MAVADAAAEEGHFAAVAVVVVVNFVAVVGLDVAGAAVDSAAVTVAAVLVVED